MRHRVQAWRVIAATLPRCGAMFMMACASVSGGAESSRPDNGCLDLVADLRRDRSWLEPASNRLLDLQTNFVRFHGRRRQGTQRKHPSLIRKITAKTKSGIKKNRLASLQLAAAPNQGTGGREAGHSPWSDGSGGIVARFAETDDP